MGFRKTVIEFWMRRSKSQVTIPLTITSKPNTFPNEYVVFEMRALSRMIHLAELSTLFKGFGWNMVFEHIPWSITVSSSKSLKMFIYFCHFLQNLFWNQFDWELTYYNYYVAFLGKKKLTLQVLTAGSWQIVVL